MVAREHAALLVGVGAGGVGFAGALLRGLGHPTGIALYLLASVAVGIAPQLYVCFAVRGVTVRDRVRMGAFVTGFLAVFSASPAAATTARGRAAVAAFLGLLVGGHLVYEFLAGFYARA